jgi:hypothetical protein
VDDGARPGSRAATLPPGGADIGGAGSGVPANYHDHNHNPAHVPATNLDPDPVPANDPGSVPANGSAPEPVGRGTSSSRGSVSLPK